MLQTNLNKAQIDKLMAELAEARQHLEFCEEAENSFAAKLLPTVSEVYEL
jgi:hypothetical protein